MQNLKSRCIKCVVLLTMMLVFSMTVTGGLQASAEGFPSLTSTKEMQKVSIKIDIDGDGVLNTVAVFHRTDSQEKYPTGYTQKVYVEVDGKEALALDVSDQLGYGAEAVFIDSGDEGMCMQLWAHSDNDYIGYNQLFRYDKVPGSFYKVLDLTEGVNRYGQYVVSAEDGKITMMFSCQPPETGWIYWERTYVWKDGKLEPENDTDEVVSTVVKKFVTDRKLKFSEEAGGKKAAFTLKKGEKVTLKRIKVTEKKIYAQFQYGKKTGWLRIENDYGKVYKYDKKGNVKNGYFKGIWKHLAG